MRRTAFAVAALIALDLLLMMSGHRILVQEQRLAAGEMTRVAGWGTVFGPDNLVCRYFTGRSVQARVYAFSPNNLMGRDECPFTLGPED